ncbi:MAG: hypothetical protein II738_05170 [Clostridia bacterium]|nr:hypothetical protein [Clostridia bacterium]
MDKTTIKKQSRGLLRIAAFLLALLAALYALSATVFSHDAAQRRGNIYVRSFSYENEAPGTVEVVFIGNSDAYAGISPAVLWKNCGYPAVVCGAAHQSPLFSEMLLKKLYRTQSPAVVVLEMDMLFDGQGKAVTSQKARFPDGPLQRLYRLMLPERLEYALETELSVIEFHNEWQRYFIGFREPPKNNHGFYFSKRVGKVDEAPDFMAPTEDRACLSADRLGMLKDTVDLCRRHGSEVMLVALPCVKYWTMARHNTVADFAEEYDLPFVDFNSDEYEDLIDNDTCYRDEGNHLNYTGAKRVTAALGERLRETYGDRLTDCRGNEAYAAWDGRRRHK